MKMKHSIRFVLFWISILMVAGLLLACGNEEIQKDTLTEEQKQEIEQFYRDINWSSTLYLGTYDGWIVLFEGSSLQSVEYEFISGYWFRHYTGFGLYVFKDGENMHLADAVEQGIISDADVAKIYQRYVEEYWKPEFLKKNPMPPDPEQYQ